MIWEVDDDCDKGVTWSEFQAMFSRCRNDKTGVLVSCCCLRFLAERHPQATSHAGYTM